MIGQESLSTSSSASAPPCGHGWFIAPVVGDRTINQNDFSRPGLDVSFIDAVMPLAAVNLLRRSMAL